MYPIFVSDGQSWKFIKSLNIDLPQNFKIHGIDISKHNGIINWQEINTSKDEKKFINFVFIKATEGADLVDVNFKVNWDNAKKNGFKRGAYHFFNAFSDPQLQALNYIVNTDHQKGDIFPVLDFEVTGISDYQKQIAANNAKIWLDLVEKKFGVKPIIYTNKPLYRKYVKNKLDGYPIWISDYFSNDLNEIQDQDLILWQHTDAGKVKGINGKVDFNVFLGSQESFQKIIL